MTYDDPPGLRFRKIGTDLETSELGVTEVLELWCGHIKIAHYRAPPSEVPSRKPEVGRAPKSAFSNGLFG